MILTNNKCPIMYTFMNKVILRKVMSKKALFANKDMSTKENTFMDI